MRVVNGENSLYTLLDLITNKEKDYHVSDMKPFILNADLVDPVDIDPVSLFPMGHVHAHNSQLRMQTCLAVDFLSNLLAIH